MSAADLDERLFQTTRLIMIVLLLKLVVEEYIRHIAPHDPPLDRRPGDGREEAVEPVELDRRRVQPALPVAHAGARPGRPPTTGPVESKTFLRDNNELVIDAGSSG